MITAFRMELVKISAQDWLNGHNLPLEFGGSEAKPRIEEDYGTEFMQEGLIKLPGIFLVQ